MSAWSDPRAIHTRMVITGDLILNTPANLGNGDAEGLTDMPLALDVVSGRPLLTGTSVAGALRSYLRECMHGYEQKEQSERISLLFGTPKGNDDGDQSSLIVDDAVATKESWNAAHIEVRDGVKIDGKTRTAEDRKKYDLELIPAGTCFPLRFELLLMDGADEATLCATLAQALGGLEGEEIFLGARTTRGFGRCRVASWKSNTYHVQTPEGLLAWLTTNHPQWGYALPPDTTRKGSAAVVLDSDPQTLMDQRKRFTIEAHFALESPLLVRSHNALTEGDLQPDTIHIRSRRNGTPAPVVPGTSLAGALRARATRILNTLAIAKTDGIINGLFGQEMDQGTSKDPSRSRLVVEESPIEAGNTLVQSRVGIDRFTGGALDTALFQEAPQVGGQVRLTMQILAPRKGEVGLLLLLLKDLWSSDLPLGGASSIGRGRLRGLSATICAGNNSTWKINKANHNDRDASLSVTGNKAELEGYVTALHEVLEGQ